jgi:mannose-1-phosphate guanylyltransferase
VPTDDTGRVTAFLEKTPNPVTNRINAGCYVFRRSVIDEIPVGRAVSVEHETFPGLIAAGSLVMGYVEHAYWLDVGTPEAFVRGSCDVVLGHMPSPAMPGACGESLLLAGAYVAGEAKVTGGTVLGAGSSVAPGAVVHGSVVFDSAIIGADAIIRDSIVGRGAVIDEGVALDGVVIGDEAHIGPGNELIRGARVWPRVRLQQTSVRFSSDA